MKSQKGLTLASVVIYILAMLIILSIVALVLSFYNKNITRMNDSGDLNLELSKFESKMIEETQIAGNKMVKVTEDSIKFNSGNTYIFADERIYQNKIIVSENIKEFSAKLETDGEKQILRVYMVLRKGKEEVVKNLSYTIKSNTTQTQYNQLTQVIK